MNLHLCDPRCLKWKKWLFLITALIQIAFEMVSNLSFYKTIKLSDGLSKCLLRNGKQGLERWLSGKEHRLLFQRSWVQFPATTWWLTAICNEIWWPFLVCLTATVYSHKINKLKKKKWKQITLKFLEKNHLYHLFSTCWEKEKWLLKWNF